MVSYLIRRLLSAVTVLLVVSAISFVVIQLPPGDFTDIYKAQLITQGGLTETEAEAAAEEMRARYGLDVPVPVQYVNWIIGIVTRGEFGYSFRYKEDVGSLIAERLPRTIGLAAAAHATSTIVGLLVGVFVGQRQYSLSDNVAAVVAFILTSLPRFFLALVIIYILVFTFDQQSVTSFYSPEYVVAPWSMGKFLDLLKHVWPVIAIAGLGGVARNLRVMRGNLLDVLNAQYVVTARSKGITERRGRQPARRAQRPASNRGLPGNGHSLHGAGGTGGRHRAEPADRCPHVLRLAAQPGHLHHGQHPAALRRAPGRGQSPVGHFPGRSRSAHPLLLSRQRRLRGRLCPPPS